MVVKLDCIVIFFVQEQFKRGNMTLVLGCPILERRGDGGMQPVAVWPIVSILRAKLLILAHCGDANATFVYFFRVRRELGNPT